MIGIAAGCELHVAELRRREFRASVLSLTAAVTTTTWAFVFPAVMLLGPHIGFLQGAPRTRLVCVASLAATLGVARSPASMIAVLRELDARGPFCSLVMSVTVVKDVLVLLLFSVNVELVQAVESSDGTGFAALAARCVATPVLKLTVSAMLGTAGGLLLGALLVQPRVGDRGALPAAVLLLAAALFLGARALPAEPLLVCVAAGALAANRREERGERQREELHGLLDALMPWINLTFFTLAGAALAVDALAATAPVAAVIHAVRLLSLVVATSADAFGLPRDMRRVCWMSMVRRADLSACASTRLQSPLRAGDTSGRGAGPCAHRARTLPGVGPRFLRADGCYHRAEPGGRPSAVPRCHRGHGRAAQEPRPAVRRLGGFRNLYGTAAGCGGDAGRRAYWLRQNARHCANSCHCRKHTLADSVVTRRVTPRLGAPRAARPLGRRISRPPSSPQAAAWAP